MLTITVQGARGRGRAQRQVEHGAQVVLELRGDRAVLGPVAGVVRPHRELVDQHPAVGGLEQLDREDAGDVELAGDLQRDLLRLSGEGRVEVGRRSDDLAADAVDAGWTARPGTPRPARSASAPTSAASSRRKSTSSSASSRTPALAAAASGSAHVGGRRTTQTPLPSYPPRVVFSDAREAEGLDLGDRRRRRRCAGTGTPSSSSRARITALSCACTSASGPGRTATPSPARACRCSVGTCSWSKVTTAQPSVTLRSVSRSR